MLIKIQLIRQMTIRYCSERADHAFILTSGLGSPNSNMMDEATSLPEGRGRSFLSDSYGNYCLQLIPFKGFLYLLDFTSYTVSDV